MAGLTHSNDTTGKDRRRYGFRHFFDAYMSGQALGPILAAEYGKDRRAYHLTADYTWGWTQEESMKGATEKQGWKTVAAVRTPLGATDFSQYITPVLNSGADVLILNHYGTDMVNSLTQAVQFGLRDKQANGKQFQIVVPLYLRADGAGAGDAIKGIYRHRQLGLEADRRQAPRPSPIVRQGLRHAAVAGRAHRATCRPSSTPMPLRRPARSIRRR